MKPLLKTGIAIIFAACGIYFAMYYQSIWNYAWDTWHGKTIAWNQLTINLQEGQFFNSLSTNRELIIGDRSEPINRMIATSGQSDKLTPSIVANDFCERVKCIKKSNTEIKLGGKVVKSAEIKYIENSAILIRYFAKVDPSKFWIEIAVTEGGYPRFYSLADSLIKQLE